MNKLDELNRLVERIREIEDSYGCSHEIIGNLTLNSFLRRAKLHDEFGLRMSDFWVCGNKSIELRSQTPFDFKIVKCPKTWCTNKTTKYEFVEDDEYIVLGNGGTGRLAFGNIESRDYSLTDSVWEKFVNKILEYSPVEYDNLNCTWIFTMQDGIRLWHDFKSIYDDTRKEFEAVLNEARIKRLQEKIDKLKSPQ